MNLDPHSLQAWAAGCARRTIGGIWQRKFYWMWDWDHRRFAPALFIGNERIYPYKRKRVRRLG